MAVKGVGFALNLAYAFGVSPPRVEMRLPAGESFTGSFTVGNPSGSPVKVRVTVEDWSSAQDGRQVIKGEVSSLGWLVFSSQELELRPNRSDIINYTVTLPKDAKGEYAAMVYFGTLPDPLKGGISVISRIGNAVYVIVEGTEIVKGEITNVIISRIEPLKIDVTIRNEGNIHIRPRGKIIIRRKGLFLKKGDRKPIEIPFNEVGFPVLPQQHYIFEAWLKERLEPGIYRLELNIQFGTERLFQKLECSVNKEGKIRMGE